MNRIMDYFRINKLTLNLNKTVCVLFQKNKTSPNEIKLQLDNHIISNSAETKFLGMTIDQNLSWSSHVNQLILKLNRNLNLLKLSRNMMTQESKLLVYHFHLEIHIQYGILLWGNGANNTQINRIQKIQNKALQYVTNKSNALENKKELKVLDINSMIELSNLKFGYRVLHNLLPPVTGKLCMFDSLNKILSKQHNYDTRNKKPIPASFVFTQTVTKHSSMKVTSQDTQRGTMASIISVLTVHTQKLIKRTMILIDLVTAGLPNIGAKPAVRSLCSIPRKGGTSRIASAPSNILNYLHFNISC